MRFRFFSYILYIMLLESTGFAIRAPKEMRSTPLVFSKVSFTSESKNALKAINIKVNCSSASCTTNHTWVIDAKREGSMDVVFWADSDNWQARSDVGSGTVVAERSALSTSTYREKLWQEGLEQYRIQAKASLQKGANAVSIAGQVKPSATESNYNMLFDGKYPQDFLKTVVFEFQGFESFNLDQFEGIKFELEIERDSVGFWDKIFAADVRMTCAAQKNGWVPVIDEKKSGDESKVSHFTFTIPGVPQVTYCYWKNA